MSTNELSRREANKAIILSVGAAAGLLGAPHVLAQRVLSQQGSQPSGGRRSGSSSGPGGNRPPQSSAPPSAPNAVLQRGDLDGILGKGRSRERTLRVDITVDGYQTPASQTRRDTMPKILELKFETAAIVFPVLRGTASSQTDIERVKGVMAFDDRPEDTTPSYNEDYHSGTRLGKWELKDKTGRQASLKLEIPMSSWETTFDEALANKIPWPAGDKWGKVGATTFERQMFVDREHPIVNTTLQQWTAGKDPKTIPPVQLAKFIAGKVAETLQPSGNGYLTNRNGMFAGMDLKGASQTLIDRRGSEHDIACALAALYRNAGLPARTVIGHDLSTTKGQRSTPFDKGKSGSGPLLRSWVEFCLYDPAADKELWIPVDVALIRSFSSRMQALDKPWKYFGAHDDLDDMLPFAFQYHPPTTVVAHGGVAFWGWFTLPETQVATQWLRFSSVSTPQGPSVDTPRKK